MKDLLKLARQYKSDVEQRIICIKEDWENADDALILNEEAADDYDTQIAHWEATLKQIDDVLNEYKIAIEPVDIIAKGYEWICPDCNKLNYEIEVTEDVVCSDCKTIFITKLPEHAYKN